MPEITVAATPARVHLEWPSGDTPTFTFTFTGVDHSSRTFTAEFRGKSKAAIPTAFTVDETNALTGIIVITAPAAADDVVLAGFWDLRSTEGADVRTWVEGEVTITPTVTDVTP